MTIDLPLAHLDVRTAMVFAEDGEPVRQSLYLHKGITPAEYPVRAGDRLLELRNPDGTFVCFNSGWKRYYHWLIQSVFPAWLLRRESGLFLFPNVTPVQRSMLTIARVPMDRCVFLPPQLKVSVSNLRLSEVCFPNYDEVPHPQLGEFGRVLAKRITGKGSAKFVYVSRRDSSRRPVANEDEVERAFADRGFDVVSLSGRPFEDQVRLFRDASIIAGPHGAGLSNIVFAAPGARVIELQASYYQNFCFAVIGRQIGLQYTCVVSQAEQAKTRTESAWRVDVDKLVPAIDDALSAATTTS